MSLQSNIKFLVRPRPLKNEMILSYLERLRSENAYSSINLICATIFGYRISLIDIVKGNFDKKIFSQYTNLNIDDIENLFLNKERHYISCNIHLCLKCFEENKYIKKEWYIRDYICSKHKIPITCRCNFCNALYKWNIFHNGFVA